jgi:hypothetical protein
MLQASEANAGQQAQCPVCAAIIPVPSSRGHLSPPAHRQEDESTRRGHPNHPAGLPTDKGWSVGLIVSVVLGLVVMCVGSIGLLWWYDEQARIAATQSQEANNLKFIGLGLENLERVHNALPQAVAYRDRNGNAGLSWRVAILPYIDQEPLYRRFKLDEPWDSPHNKALLSAMPDTFLRPNQQDSPGGLTHYLAVTGQGSAFDQNHPTIRQRGRMPPPTLQLGLNITDIDAGTSNTIFVVTAAKAVPWTKPEDFDSNAGPIVPRLNTEFQSTAVLFGDRSTRHLKDTPESKWKRLMDVKGEEWGVDW